MRPDERDRAQREAGRRRWRYIGVLTALSVVAGFGLTYLLPGTEDWSLWMRLGGAVVMGGWIAGTITLTRVGGAF